MSEALAASHNLDKDEVAMIAGSIMLTKTECQSAVNLTALLKAKAENIRQSFLDTAIKEIEKRGWGVVEYAINTTGLDR